MPASCRSAGLLACAGTCEDGDAAHVAPTVGSHIIGSIVKAPPTHPVTTSFGTMYGA